MIRTVGQLRQALDSHHDDVPLSVVVHVGEIRQAHIRQVAQTPTAIGLVLDPLPVPQGLTQRLKAWFR